MNDKVEDKTSATRTSRRALIKKGLAIGGAAYVAPMIVGAVTPVSGQQISNPSPGCIGASCGNFISCAGGNCFCWTLSTGGGFCGTDFFCNSVPDCTGDPGFPLTCPPGSVCAVNTCCVVPKCTPVSSLCVTPTNNVFPSNGTGPLASGRIL